MNADDIKRNMTETMQTPNLYITETGEQHDLEIIQAMLLLAQELIYYCPFCSCYHPVDGADYNQIDKAL